MRSYGQFCPVAKAAEILAERWILLMIRELLLDCHHFNEIRQGLPHISTALLAQRLPQLERAGIVEQRSNDSGRTELSII